MILVEVKNLQGTVTHRAQWETETEADTWIAVCVQAGYFGNTDHWVEDYTGPREKLDEADMWCEEFLENGRSRIRCHFPLNYKIEKRDVTAEVAQEEANRKALAYLLETDWYVIRELDSGVVVPDDVKQKRAEARLAINR